MPIGNALLGRRGYTFQCPVPASPAEGTLGRAAVDGCGFAIASRLTVRLVDGHFVRQRQVVYGGRNRWARAFRSELAGCRAVGWADVESQVDGKPVQTRRLDDRARGRGDERLVHRRGRLRG